MKKLAFIFVFASFMIGCSGSQNTNNENRTIREDVVAVKSDKNSTVLASGRYDNWYLVNTPLTEGMNYRVTLEIPRQRENSQIIKAQLTDFTPGAFVQRDVFARYKMAYNQWNSGNKDELILQKKTETDTTGLE